MESIDREFCKEVRQRFYVDEEDLDYLVTMLHRGCTEVEFLDVIEKQFYVHEKGALDILTTLYRHWIWTTQEELTDLQKQLFDDHLRDMSPRIERYFIGEPRMILKMGLRSSPTAMLRSNAPHNPP